MKNMMSSLALAKVTMFAFALMMLSSVTGCNPEAALVINDGDVVTSYSVAGMM